MSIVFSTASSQGHQCDGTGAGDALDNKTAMAGACWVYHTDFYGNNDNGIITKRGANPNADKGWVFGVDGASGSERLSLIVGGSTNSIVNADATTITLSLNKWYYYCFSFDKGGAAADQKLAIGDLSTICTEPTYASQTLGSGFGDDTGQPLTFATNRTNFPNWSRFGGRISWLCLWDQTRTIKDFQTVQFNPRAAFRLPGLKAYWRLGWNGVGATDLRDLSGNKLHSTSITGSPTVGQPAPVDLRMAPTRAMFIIPAAAVTTVNLDSPVSSWVVTDPTTTPGAVIVSLDAPVASWTVTDPTTSPGAVTVSLDTPVASWTVTDPTTSPGVATVSLDAPVASWTVNDPTTSPGVVTVSLDAPVASWSVTDPTTSPGAVTVSLDTPVSSWSVTDPTTTSGIVINLDAPVASWTVNDPTTSPGAVTVSLDAPVASWTVTDPTTTSGTIINLDAPVASWSVTDPTTSPGAVTVSLDAPVSSWSVTDPTTSPGAVTVSLDAPVASWTVNDPTTSPGAVTVSLDAPSASWTVTDPTTSPGAVTVSLDTPIASWSVTDPTMTSNNIIVSLDSPVSSWVVTDPSVLVIGGFVDDVYDEWTAPAYGMKFTTPATGREYRPRKP